MAIAWWCMIVNRSRRQLQTNFLLSLKKWMSNSYITNSNYGTIIKSMMLLITKQKSDRQVGMQLIRTWKNSKEILPTTLLLSLKRKWVRTLLLMSLLNTILHDDKHSWKQHEIHKINNQIRHYKTQYQASMYLTWLSLINFLVSNATYKQLKRE